MVEFFPPHPTPPGRFRDSVKKLSPPWLAGLNGYRFMYSLGIQLDAIAEYFRIGALQRFPSYCEEEALPHLGLDRGIGRGPTEPVASYRERLRTFKPTWRTAGHPKAVLGQLAGYFAPTPPLMRIVSNGYDASGNTIADWWTLDGGVYTHVRATPSNWDWDGHYANYRFWLILYLDHLPVRLWDDGSAWDGPGVLWGFKNGQAVVDVRALLDQWKCAGTHCDKIILAGPRTTTAFSYYKWGTAGAGTWGTSGHLWGAGVNVPFLDPTNAPGQPNPDGTWGDPANRDPAGQYLEGI